MKIAYTRKFSAMYADLPNRVKRKAEKQERLFRMNMFHPSLHTEKLMPKNNNLWSFRVNDSYRIIFHFEKNAITFVYIGHHNDIYKFV